MKDDTARKLAAQVQPQVRNILVASLLGGVPSYFGEAEVHLAPSSTRGATSAIIYEANARLRFFVKVHLADAVRELQGYRRLAKASPVMASHLVSPVGGGTSDIPIMLYPYVSAETFHALVLKYGSSSRPQLEVIYEHFLQTLYESLWKPTRHRSSRILSFYSRRLMSRSRDLASAWGRSSKLDFAIRVNGKDYGTASDVISSVTERLRQCIPSFACTIHGDEHAKNLMVDMAEPDSWVLIDYVNANPQGDWVFSLAKMLQWWRLYSAIEEATHDADLARSLKSRTRVSDRLVSARYEHEPLRRALPATAKAFEKRTLAFGDRVGRRFRDSTWRERLPLAYFCVLWASIVHHVSERPFAVPPMLDECLSAAFADRWT
jgi:hypothetical protein